ncbi:substrate-binding domain-containing protein [Tissierella pigra]|uniref:Phosphate ABC transporter substrate-binding protein n=1 Tax=Tissierella pigra TaxID=2607614 RepID=A0A6N7XHY9_9FIRM|nr:substrate-binding domain-containing protein [Tissierella pigra]MBU5428337.1 substrate-binding domain-containing protein [Tissierella pigra]MSU01661.1 phosphate ABC transporter substrate-binding protein [Tissierella pigra]
MKKIVALALSLVLALSLLAGCKSNNQDGENIETGKNNKKEFDSSKEIVVVTREEGSGTRGAFVELTGIEEKDGNGNKVDKTTKEAITQMKTDTVLTTVAGDEYAIGYVSTGSLQDTIKALSIDGIKPTTENIKNGSYKIARPFNVATKHDVSEITHDFIDYIMSKEGQEVVSQSYIAIDDNAEPYKGSKPAGKIVVAGSSSVTPVMEKLREAYLEINPNAEIEIQQSDSSAGIKAATDGTCDIGMASRALKDSEITGLQNMEIALDGIAVIINPNNTLTDISLENVKKVFTGEFTNWSDIK